MRNHYWQAAADMTAESEAWELAVPPPALLAEGTHYSASYIRSNSSCYQRCCYAVRCKVVAR